MKNIVFRTAPPGSGFIRTNVAPINDKRDSLFGVWDALEVITLVFGIVLVMRFVLTY